MTQNDSKWSPLKTFSLAAYDELSLTLQCLWINHVQTKVLLICLFLCVAAEDNNKEIIELQDLRMSPIPSIRNRFGGASGRTRSDVADNFPPSFRINRGYSTASGGRSSATGLRRSASGTSGSAMEKARQSRLLSQLKKGTSTLKAALPRIKDVNIIDKYSRVIFPVSFLVFNIAYWCFYVLEKNEEWTQILITQGNTYLWEVVWELLVTRHYLLLHKEKISRSQFHQFHFLLAKSDIDT